MYKPLPKSITIRSSPIEGLGLFATEKISTGNMIGKIHIPAKKEEHGYLRTPLGAFGNHSNTPNCFKLLMDDGTWWIMSNRKIMAGEEVTWQYSLYKI